MKFKKILEDMKDKALIYKMDFSTEESAKVKVQDRYEATPIGGLDLYKFCAFNGARIENAEDIKLDKEYYLEFLGLATYKAIESKENNLIKISLNDAITKISQGENVYQKIDENYKLLQGNYDLSYIANIFQNYELFAEK